MLRLGLCLPSPGEVGHERSIAYSEQAAAGNVDVIWLAEGRGWDTIVLLTQLIERLDDVEFGSVIF